MEVGNNPDATQGDVPVDSINLLNVLSKLPLSEGHKSYQNNSETS